MHRRYLQIALELASKNVIDGGGPFGAVIVKNGEILATGANRVSRENDPTAHAEIMAIRAACRQLQSFSLADCILYSSCEPCPMCLGAIYWARPAAVYFVSSRHDAADAGFDDSFIYCEIGKAPQERAIPMYQLHIPDSDKPFQNWRTQTNKTRY